MITIQKSSTSLNKFLHARFLGNSWRTVWSICIPMLDIANKRRLKKLINYLSLTNGNEVSKVIRCMCFAFSCVAIGIENSIYPPNQ